MGRSSKYIYIPFKPCLKRKGGEELRFVDSLKRKTFDVRSVNNAINQFENNGCIYRKGGSGRPITVDTSENQMKVVTLALSQDDQPGAHDAVLKIAQKMGYSKSSVHRQLRKCGNKSVKVADNDNSMQFNDDQEGRNSS